MATKIIIGICLIIATTLGGAKFAATYKFRKEFFDALTAFNVQFSSEVSFYKHTLKESFEGCSEILKHTFCAAVNELEKNGKYVCIDKQLTAEQRTFVSEYVSMLGLSDENGQIEMLKVFGERLKGLQNSAEIAYQKYAKLYPKLGFLTGVSTLIVLI